MAASMPGFGPSETKEYLWQAELKKDKKTVRWDGHPDGQLEQIVLKLAVLGPNAVKDERNIVEVVSFNREQDKVKTCICSLTMGAKENQTLSDLSLFPPVNFTLIQGSGPLHITANHIVLEEEEDDGLSDDEDDESDEVDEENFADLREKLLNRVANGKGDAKLGKRKASEGDDDGDDDDDDDDDGAKPPNSPVLGQDSPNLIMSDIDNIDAAKSDLVAKEDDDVRSEENAEVDVQSRHVTPLAAKSETHTDKNPEDEESDKHNDVTEPVFDLSSGQAVQNLPSNDNVESNTLNEQEPNEDQNNLPERDAADGTEESEGRDTRKSQESETNLAHASSIIDNSNEEGEKQRSGEESQEISNTPSARPATSESTENTPQDQTPGKRIDEQPIPNGQPTSLTEQV